MQQSPVTFGNAWSTTGAILGGGWSGLAGSSTSTNDATEGSSPATTASPGWAASLASGCTLCQNPLFLEGVFAVAIIMFVIAWRAHLHSILE